MWTANQLQTLFSWQVSIRWQVTKGLVWDIKILFRRSEAYWQVTIWVKEASGQWQTSHTHGLYIIMLFGALTSGWIPHQSVDTCISEPSENFWTVPTSVLKVTWQATNRRLLQAEIVRSIPMYRMNKTSSLWNQLDGNNYLNRWNNILIAHRSIHERCTGLETWSISRTGNTAQHRNSPKGMTISGHQKINITAVPLIHGYTTNIQAWTGQISYGFGTVGQWNTSCFIYYAKKTPLPAIAHWRQRYCRTHRIFFKRQMEQMGARMQYPDKTGHYGGGWQEWWDTRTCSLIERQGGTFHVGNGTQTMIDWININDIIETQTIHKSFSPPPLWKTIQEKTMNIHFQGTTRIITFPSWVEVKTGTISMNFIPPIPQQKYHQILLYDYTIWTTGTYVVRKWWYPIKWFVWGDKQRTRNCRHIRIILLSKFNQILSSGLSEVPMISFTDISLHFATPPVCLLDCCLCFGTRGRLWQRDCNEIVRSLCYQTLPGYPVWKVSISLIGNSYH